MAYPTGHIIRVTSVDDKIPILQAKGGHVEQYITLRDFLRIPTGAPIDPVNSTLSTALAGANNDLTYTAKTAGIIGDSITIRYIGGTDINAHAVSVTGTAITVQCKTTGTTITTSSGDIITLIEASAAASALVGVVNKGEDNGTGAVIAMAATPLAGGIDGTDALSGTMVFDGSNLYISDGDSTSAVSNWKTINIKTKDLLLLDLSADDYTLDLENQTVIITVGKEALNLPVATGSGVVISISNQSYGDVVLTPDATDNDTLDGATSLTMETMNCVIIVDYDAHKWATISRNITITGA